jgi:hypothetical protein
MSYVVKAMALVLVAMAFLAPVAPTEHCAGDGDVHAEAECACECCCDAAPACIEQVSAVTAHAPESHGFTKVLGLGRLSVADIFRPPTSA